jgi:hypothetical protein
MGRRFIFLMFVLVLGSVRAYAKRAPPEDVPPVIDRGIKYSADYRRIAGGANQNDQYIDATDLQTGKMLWELRLYEVKYDPNLEEDAQDLFLSSMKLMNGNLEVLNEAGDRFVIDLSRRQIIIGATRVYHRPAESPLDGPLRVDLPTVLTILAVVLLVGIALARSLIRKSSSRANHDR